jgi:hypothetical protein
MNFTPAMGAGLHFAHGTLRWLKDTAGLSPNPAAKSNAGQPDSTIFTLPNWTAAISAQARTFVPKGQSAYWKDHNILFLMNIQLHFKPYEKGFIGISGEALAFSCAN